MQYLIFFTIFLIPFYFLRFTVAGVLPTNVFEVAVTITFLVGVFFAFKRKKFVLGSPIPYLLIVAVSAAILLSNSISNGLGILKGWFIIPLLLYLLIINNFDQKNIAKISIPLYLDTLVISAWAIAQKFGIITTLFYQRNDLSFNQYLSEHFRVFGPFESPNYLAMFLVPVGFLSIAIFQYVKPIWLKILLALTYLLPLAALFLSGSRGGAIALILAALIYLFIDKKDKFLDSAIISTGLAIVVFLAFAIAAYKFGFNPANDAIRIEIYKYSWSMLKENWAFGIGLGNFHDSIAAITPMAENFRTFALPYALHPHNIFMAFWLNAGLVGIFTFLLVIINFFWQMMKNQSKNLIWGGAFMAMIAILTHGLFDTTYWKNDLSAIFWLALAIGFIYSQSKINVVEQNKI